MPAKPIANANQSLTTSIPPIMTEHQEIIQKTGKPHSCSCNTCQNMCATVPCLGTPSNILQLINNGLVGRLGATRFAAFINYGKPIVDMVQAKRIHGHGCTFFKNGLCELHDQGLKPIEGQIASCKVRTSDIEKHPSYVVSQTWLDPRNLKTITLVFKALIRYEKSTKA